MPYLKYLRVTVPYYIPIAVLGMLTGAILTIKTLPDIGVVYAAVSLAFLVCGFNTLNGVYDKNIDRINKPNRPLASGKISVRAGIAYALVLYLFAFLFSFLTNYYFILILTVSAILTVSYSLPSVRLRSKFIINTLTGLIFYGLLCPLAGWALYPGFRIPYELIIFIFILGSGIAITKDFEDIYGDKIFGIKTVPTVFGVKGTIIVAFLIIFSFAYMGYITLAGIVDIKYLAVLVFMPWALHTIYSLNPGNHEKSEGNNNKMFFIKNMLLAISIELFLIAIALI